MNKRNKIIIFEDFYSKLIQYGDECTDLTSVFMLMMEPDFAEYNKVVAKPEPKIINDQDVIYQPIHIFADIVEDIRVYGSEGEGKEFKEIEFKLMIGEFELTYPCPIFILTAFNGVYLKTRYKYKSVKIVSTQSFVLNNIRLMNQSFDRLYINNLIYYKKHSGFLSKFNTTNIEKIIKKKMFKIKWERKRKDPQYWHPDNIGGRASKRLLNDFITGIL